MYWDIQRIKKEIKKLNIPNKYYHINLDQFFSHDFYMMISIRENAGKTTSWLITALICNMINGCQLEYLKSDIQQIRQKGTENLFNTVRELGYIDKIYKGRWNDVIYKSRSRKFFLCRKEDGEIVEEDAFPVCVVHALEESEDIKSVYNNPNGNLIVYDEFLDTRRATMDQWGEFMNLISTIGRPGTRLDEKTGLPMVRVAMLGNNTNQYNHWFDDFCITEEIERLKFGHYFEMKTEMGTSLICYMLDQDEKLKETVTGGKLHFFGFPTKKAAVFNGITEWSGKTYKHLNFSIRELRPKYNRLFIKHRNRLIQCELYKNEENYFVFAHFANEPWKDDNIILCLDPVKKCEVYGLADYENNDRIVKVVRTFFRFRYENRWYYASNYVGEIVDDFEKNIGK